MLDNDAADDNWMVGLVKPPTAGHFVTSVTADDFAIFTEPLRPLAYAHSHYELFHKLAIGGPPPILYRLARTSTVVDCLR